MKFTLDRVAKILLPRVEPGEFFAPFDRRVLGAAAEVLVIDTPLKISGTEAIRVLEKFLIDGRSPRAWRIRVLVILLEFSPLALGRPRFSRMPSETRVRFMREKLIGGRGVWGICSKVKQLVYIGVYGHPSAERELGFPTWQERPRAKAIPARATARAPRESTRQPEGISP